MSQLRKLEDEAACLSLKDMLKLAAYLNTQIRMLQEEEESGREREPHQLKGREVVTLKKAGAVTYQLERIKCGKENCKCSKGQGHGPYWYKYWSVGGRTKSAYIGKNLPGEGSDTSSIAVGVNTQADRPRRKAS